MFSTNEAINKRRENFGLDCNYNMVRVKVCSKTHKMMSFRSEVIFFGNMNHSLTLILLTIMLL